MEGVRVPWMEEMKTDGSWGTQQHIQKSLFLGIVGGICLSKPGPEQTLYHGTWHSGVTQGIDKGMSTALEEGHRDSVSSGELALMRRERG